MSKSTNYLDADNSILNTKLRFVKNELEEDLNEIFGDVKQEEAELKNSRPYKIIKPDPGICVKAFRVSNNEKCFVNICQSDGIPPPEDITADQLTEILSSEMPSSFKIPMSITELRLTPDKSGNDAVVCDVAIHPDFFRKIEAVVIFRDFLITIIFEALDTKYNVQINRETWMILKNRKCMGNLVKHRVQNRDIRNVYESYQNPSKTHKTLINELSSDGLKMDSNKTTLIKEIGSKSLSPTDDQYSMANPSSSTETILPVKQSNRNAAIITRKPEYKLFKANNDAGTTNSIVAEFHMPEVMAENEITLDLGVDRLVLEARRAGYLLDSFFPCGIDANQSKAQFNSDLHILTVKMPIHN